MKPTKIPYSYPALDIHEQIDLLVQKGLVISDPTAVVHWLSHNSYLRFKHYSPEFKDYKNNSGNYISKTTFEKVRDLYFTHISNIMSGTLGFIPNWQTEKLWALQDHL